MFKKWFGKGDEQKVRVLNHPADLQPSDFLTFKPFDPLPEDLQGATLTVKRVQAYQYSDGLMPEYVMETTDGRLYTMVISDEDGEEELTLSRKISGPEAEAIFGADNIGELWGDAPVRLAVLSMPDGLAPWLASSYFQTIQEGVAYFFNSDRRQQGVSQYADDGSEELRYHECEGDPDHFGMSVEIWADGSTEFFLQISVPTNMIEEMWPNG